MHLGLVHHEVLVIPTAFKLLAVATVLTEVLSFHLVEGEVARGEATQTPVPGQDRQGELLEEREEEGRRKRGGEEEGRRGGEEKEEDRCQGEIDTLILQSCAQLHQQTHPVLAAGRPHLLSAHVHTLVDRHVQDDRADRQGQRHVVRTMETAFEYGAPVWNTASRTHTRSATHRSVCVCV